MAPDLFRHAIGGKHDNLIKGILYALDKQYTPYLINELFTLARDPGVPYRISWSALKALSSIPGEKPNHKQGLHVGRLESFVDNFLVENGERQRFITYGELENKVSNLETNAWLMPVVNILHNFDFHKRPVLARMLADASSVRSSGIGRPPGIERSGVSEEGARSV